MPVIGDRSRFAIEYRLDSDRGGAWLFGNACFWIGGERLGDFTQLLSLRDFLFAAEADRQKGRRRRKDDSRLSSMALDEALAVLEGDEVYRLGAAVDALADWRLYFVGCGELGRFMWRSPNGKTDELSLWRRDFDRVLEDTFHELGALYMDEVIRLVDHGARRYPTAAHR